MVLVVDSSGEQSIYKGFLRQIRGNLYIFQSQKQTKDGSLEDYLYVTIRIRNANTFAIIQNDLEIMRDIAKNQFGGRLPPNLGEYGAFDVESDAMFKIIAELVNKHGQFLQQSEDCTFIR